MLIYPAIDLMNGSCVRLTEGDFDSAKSYSDDPLAALEAFADQGAEWTHVVDLDAARDQSPRQHDLLVRLAKASRAKLQVAGGFRTPEQCERLFDAGAARVVIGSLCARDPDKAVALVERFGAERITIALDIRIKDGVTEVATAGWAAASEWTLWDLAERLSCARHFLITDIGRDGRLAGPNVLLYEEAARRLPDAQIQASGGVASLDDLHQLAGSGAAGAIVGKALWEGRFGLEDAIRAGR